MSGNFQQLSKQFIFRTFTSQSSILSLCSSSAKPCSSSW